MEKNLFTFYLIMDCRLIVEIEPDKVNINLDEYKEFLAGFHHYCIPKSNNNQEFIYYSHDFKEGSKTQPYPEFLEFFLATKRFTSNLEYN